MKVADAYIAAIDCLREHGGDSKQAQSAIKILDAKYQKLRLRAECAAVAKTADLSLFEDAYDQLDNARTAEIRKFFRGTVCENCGGRKPADYGFCPARCWPRLHAKIRFGMHALIIGQGWEGAYQKGLEWLRLSNLPEHAIQRQQLLERP